MSWKDIMKKLITPQDRQIIQSTFLIMIMKIFLKKIVEYGRYA